LCPIESLTKHTEAVKADAAAAGKGDAALAGLKAEASETAAVLKNGGQETDKQSDAFDDLKDSAMAAATERAVSIVVSRMIDSLQAFRSSSIIVFLLNVRRNCR
jgi:hypothetical protein